MRRFYDPMARALIEQRRDLLWSAENGRRVTQVLRAVSNHPEGAFDSPRAYLVVRAAIRRLAEAGEGGRRWRRCRRRWPRRSGRRRCRSRTATSATPTSGWPRPRSGCSRRCARGPPDEEIARLMDELRQATRDYMEQMARDAIAERRDAAGGDPARPDHDPGPDPGADGPDPGAVGAGEEGRGRGAARDAAADAREHADDDGPEPGRARARTARGSSRCRASPTRCASSRGWRTRASRSCSGSSSAGAGSRARTASRARRTGERRRRRAATTGRWRTGRRRCAG